MLTIWGRGNSVNVKKVLWCAEELALSYEHINAGGTHGIVNDAAFLEMNPNGLVPCIEDDGFILWESNAIVRYLAGKHSQSSLTPADARGWASADRWMDWTSLSFAAPFRDVFLNLVRLPPEKRDHAAVAKGIEQCNRLTGIADAALEDRPYLSGDQFGIGDIPLGCITYAWFGLPIERTPRPHLSAWYDRLTARAGYQKAVMTALT